MTANPNEVEEVLKALQEGQHGSFVFKGRRYSYDAPAKKAPRKKKVKSDG